jgi:uncharacterized protein (TIGR00375 family)
MEVITDLHLHSRFSRAVSKEMNLPTMDSWAVKKGIGLLGTGDFTHPVWYREILSQLTQVKEGVYELKTQFSNSNLQNNKKPKFLLTTELSCIYSQGGKVRRIHLLILAPNLEAVEKLNKTLTQKKANLLSDGRPILGMTARDLTQLILEINENYIVIPAHVWTPWFSLYGSMSGFGSIDECFADVSGYITSIETGLSSDPAMNWRVEELQNRNIVSFGDAHSPAKLGREATVFELPEITFENIKRSLTSENPSSQIAYTIEFYPEEGKYHYTGHRNCGTVYSPKQIRKLGTVCPVCGKPLTVGVMSRVEHLAKRAIEIIVETDEFGVRWIKEKDGRHTPYIMLVPLSEIITESISSAPNSKKVTEVYNLLTTLFGGEFNVLLKTKLLDIEKICGRRMSEAISKVRSGNIHIEPGYDGVFGKVKIWSSQSEDVESKPTIDQEMLF